MGTFFSSFAQDILSSCGNLPPTQAEIESSIGYGDNRALMDILRKQGFDIPENYLEMNAEEREKVEKRNANQRFFNTDKSMNSCDIYYVPVTFWNYEMFGISAALAITEPEIDRLLFVTNIIYKRNNVPIILYKKNVVNIPFYTTGLIRWNADRTLAQRALNALGSNVSISEMATSALEFSIVQGFFNLNKDSDAYNVHCFARAFHAGGRAEGVPSQACFITTEGGGGLKLQIASTNENSNHGLMAHEIGHCFGLFHTHDCTGLWGTLTQISNGNRAQCAACNQEYVTRTARQCFPFDALKCEAHGDLLCDTEADPNLGLRVRPSSGSNPSPVYTPVTGEPNTDFENVTWRPDLHNVMSYTSDRFMDKFSPMQGARMAANLATKSFVNCSAPGTSKSLTGATTFCTNALPETYTLTNPPANTLIRWTLINSNGFAIQNADADGSLTTTNTSITVNIPQATSRTAILMAAPTCTNCTPVYKNLSTTVGAVRIVTGPTQVAKNTFASFEANAGKGNYVWFVPQGWNAYNQVGNQLLAWVGPNAQCGDIRVNSADTDGCGASYDTKPVRVDDLCPVPSSGGSGGGSGCGEMLAADGQPSFTVHLNANSKTLDLSRVYEKDLELTIVRIIDSKPYYTAKMQMTERIDLSTLPADSYVARVAPSSGSIGCLTFYNFVLMD